MKTIRQSIRAAGFTLIELIVVVSILIIITSVMLANHARYGGSVILENLAYDIALTIRQAQVYGISVARNGSGSSAVFNVGYGMYFQKGASQYILFADSLTPNGTYDSGEAVSVTNMSGGYSIYDICATPTGSASSTCGYTRLDVLYLRPEPGAWITAGSTDPSGLDSCLNVHGNCKKNANIIVVSPRGDKMMITVWGNGQISVQQNIIAAP